MPPALALAFGPRREVSPAARMDAKGRGRRAESPALRMDDVEGLTSVPRSLAGPGGAGARRRVRRPGPHAVARRAGASLYYNYQLLLSWDNGLTPSTCRCVPPLYYYYHYEGQWTDASDRSIDDGLIDG